MLGDEVAEIHAIELVAGKDEHQIMGVGGEVLEIASHRIGRALIPVSAVVRLLGGQNLHEPAAKRIKLKAGVDVAV
jgi:hypothetical protein